MAFLRRLHLWIGVLGLFAFLATGQYMRFGWDDAFRHDLMARWTGRSTHIYLLISSALNVAVGALIDAKRRADALQWLISSLFLVGPPWLLAGFFLKPGLPAWSRPYSIPALYGIFGGAVLLVVRLWRERR